MTLTNILQCFSKRDQVSVFKIFIKISNLQIKFTEHYPPDLWDYNLNDKDPVEVSYGSEQKFYFKCARGLHPSYKRTPNSITCTSYNKKGALNCFICGS